MGHRSLITASTAFCLLLSVGNAHAQLVSPCLRPLGIPDKWIENQTPPWDPTDTFDPTGPNPDVYLAGYDPLADQGLPMSLVLYNRFDPPQGRSAWAVQISAAGSLAFQADIAGCSGYPHSVGQSFPSVTGNVVGPLGAAIEALIEQDPDATWDPTANGGRGGVINSAFSQSPRIMALPVFAPDAYGQSTSTSPPMVKIVGFFVSQWTTGEVHGYLTGWSQLSAPAVSGRWGDFVLLSATVTGPGSPVAGVPVEFLYNDMVVATAETDGTGTARPSTTSFRIDPIRPGEYPGAFRVRLAEPAGFFVADEVSADLTVQRRPANITWAQPAEITYGAPLGPSQLNAGADIAGQFTYSPAAGTVLPAGDFQSLSVTFVPEDLEWYEETTATNFITVGMANVVLTINNATKLYLDPLPSFTFSATGLVNGDDASVIFGAATLQTTATASSGVGNYPITLGGAVGAENYSTTVIPGVLSIVARPTVTVVQSAAPSPSTYSQVVTFNVRVSSSVGMPGGTVTLLRGDVPVATGTLLDGLAALSVSSLNGGNHQLSVAYAGAGGFAASSSAVVAHTVNRANTTTQLVSSVNPSRTGQAVTFTATVNPVTPGSGTPDGSIEFLRAGVVIATIPLASGRAQLAISNLAAGKHAIQARYVGTVNYAESASAVLQQSVKGGGK